MGVWGYIYILPFTEHFNFKILIPGSHFRPTECIRIIVANPDNSDDQARFEQPSLRLALLAYYIELAIHAINLTQSCLHF